MARQAEAHQAGAVAVQNREKANRCGGVEQVKHPSDQTEVDAADHCRLLEN